MARFSERNGFKPARLEVQLESIDDDTRRMIWNELQPFENFLLRASYEFSAGERFAELMWIEHFKGFRGEDGVHAALVWTRMKAEIIDGDWLSAFDLLEVFVDCLYEVEFAGNSAMAVGIQNLLNDVFSRTLLEYRFIDDVIVQVGTDLEAEVINAAIDSEGTLRSARDHLSRAVRSLADRATPDPLSVIRESVLAAEAAARAATGKSSLGEAVNEIKRRRPETHPALISGWSKIYGWSSDQGGIRHGSKELTAPDIALAKWMLASCAAFITYLAETELGSIGLDESA